MGGTFGEAASHEPVVAGRPDGAAEGPRREAKNNLNDAGVLVASQKLIVNMYTLIALLYCGASAWLFYTVAQSPFLGAVHLFSLTVIAANFLMLQVTGNYAIATHVILSIGTLVVGSLFGTGGWMGSGWLWTFAYLPYAFFLASTRAAQLWVGILVAVDIALVGLDRAGRIDVPYSDTALVNFFAALGVFLLCMFLFKRAVLASERTNARQARDLEATNARLRTSEADLAQAQHVAQLGSWTYDVAADRIGWSAEMHSMFGVTPPHAPKGIADFLTFIHGDDRPRVTQAYEALRETGAPLTLDVRVLRRDGALVRVHINARAQRSRDGRVERMLGTAQDVTKMHTMRRRHGNVRRCRCRSLRA